MVVPTAGEGRFDMVMSNEQLASEGFPLTGKLPVIIEVRYTKPGVAMYFSGERERPLTRFAGLDPPVVVGRLLSFYPRRPIVIRNFANGDRWQASVVKDNIND